ncbi:MAG: sugar phosphate isomerase/epimerase family protein, partial [Armatimonadota bacterium]
SMMSYTMARGLPEGETLDIAGLCQFTLDLDMDGVDWVTTYGYDPADIRRIMDDYGLATVCYTFPCDLNFPTAAERAPGRDVFRRGIEAAVALGTDKVMLPIGGKSGMSREESFRNVVDGLHEVIGIADAADITVTVEHFSMATAPFLVSEDMNRAIAEIPQLRVTFDSGNCFMSGESAREAFLNSREYIVHAHFKDWSICEPGTPGARLGLDGRYYRATLVGDGDVDNAEAIAAMRECGYRGYINFEYEGCELTPREATLEGVRRLRDWMAGAT